MRKAIVMLAAAALAGCVTDGGPRTTIYKAGSTKSQRQADYDACKIQSFKSIPQTMATEVTPGYSSPGTAICNTYGTMTTCNTVGGFDVPATASSYDVNASLRGRFINSCLRAKGYVFYTKPACKTEAERQEAIRNPGPDAKCIGGSPMQD